MAPDPTHGLIEIEPLGDTTVVRFTHRTLLDPLAIEAVGARLRGLVREEGRRDLLFNFAKVESLPSAMLGTFTGLVRELGTQGRLVFCSVDPFLMQIFRICSLPPEVALYPDEAQALAAMAAPAV